MNGKELFEKFTDIDNKFIYEVENAKAKYKNPINWFGLVACLLFVATAIVALPKILPSSQDLSSEVVLDICGATGLCIVSGDSYIIIIDNCPVVMINDTGDENIFDDLQTGDTISIEFSQLMETYPGKTTIYSLEILEKGTIEDIPQDIIDSLNELNWEITE